MVSSLVTQNAGLHSSTLYDTASPRPSARGNPGLFSFAEYPTASCGDEGKENKVGNEKNPTSM
jgi:hypothetical protein